MSCLIEETFVIGVNHHNTDAAERGKFSLTPEQQEVLYDVLKSSDNVSCAILSTCNRTEIYGVGNSRTVVEEYGKVLDCQERPVVITERKRGNDAVTHILKVACGLDSKVIGDQEILGQFKKAIKLAKKKGVLNGYMERLSNYAIQAAKEIKRTTKISSGTVSLSYAAIKYIKRKVKGRDISVLIIGTGDFGKRVAGNVSGYLPNATLTLCNRTAEKAEDLALKLGCHTLPFENLSSAIDEHDIIISSVNSKGSHLIDETNVSVVQGRSKILVDMSIPFSVDPELSESGHTIVNIDDISKEIDRTLALRKQDVPLAIQVIERHVHEFTNWSRIFENSSTIRQWKEMVTHVSNSCPHLRNLDYDEKNRIVKKKLADFTAYLKRISDLPNESGKIIQHFLNECCLPKS